MSSLRDKISTRQQRGIFHKQLGYKWEFRHPNFLRVTIPTLPFEAFDSAGEKILPWHLMKLFDSGELSSYWPITDEKDNKEQKEKAMLYVLYYELEMDSSLYDTTTPKFPLYFEFQKRFVKRTSALCSAVLRHPSRLKPYAKEEIVQIRVDPETRKPFPFPVWWKDHFGFPTSGERPKHEIPPRARSTRLFQTEHTLSFSEVDENGHANFSTYNKICFNSFAEHLFAGRLELGAERLFENGLKKLQITYMKECLLGITLNIELWRDEGSSDTYYFEVKNNGETCAKQTFIFHRQSNSSIVPSNKL